MGGDGGVVVFMCVYTYIIIIPPPYFVFHVVIYRFAVFVLVFLLDVRGVQIKGQFGLNEVFFVYAYLDS